MKHQVDQTSSSNKLIKQVHQAISSSKLMKQVDETAS
jgi:hypothetical protein